MSETAPYAYYHTMGPRDSRNTVYEGLRRGYRFGFVGSTDHHAGFPGSYGDGKMAVWAEKKTRESIWEAMLAHRTYAVTGDRIQCRFSVNDAPMGAIVRDSGSPRQIRYWVKGCYNLDKIVILKNLRPIRIEEGLLKTGLPSDRRYKFRVEMGWGNNEKELFAWKGCISLSKGRILDAEPCFRGRSVLSPSTVDTEGYDFVNDIDDRILEQNEEQVQWQCFTVKNPAPTQPLTSAVIVELEGTLETEISVNINGHQHTATVAELMQYGYTEQMKPYHSQAFKVHPVLPESVYTAMGELIDEAPAAGDFYHMEVYQANGSCAFVTPVYFE